MSLRFITSVYSIGFLSTYPVKNRHQNINGWLVKKLFSTTEFFHVSHLPAIFITSQNRGLTKLNRKEISLQFSKINVFLCRQKCEVAINKMVLSNCCKKDKNHSFEVSGKLSFCHWYFRITFCKQ